MPLHAENHCHVVRASCHLILTTFGKQTLLLLISSCRNPRVANGRLQILTAGKSWADLTLRSHGNRFKMHYARVPTPHDECNHCVLQTWTNKK